MAKTEVEVLCDIFKEWRDKEIEVENPMFTVLEGAEKSVSINLETIKHIKRTRSAFRDARKELDELIASCKQSIKPLPED